MCKFDPFVCQQVGVHGIDFTEAAHAGSQQREVGIAVAVAVQMFLRPALRSSRSTEPEEISSRRLLTRSKPKMASAPPINAPATASAAMNRTPTDAAR